MKYNIILFVLLTSLPALSRAYKISNVECLYTHGYLCVKSIEYNSQYTVVEFESTELTDSLLTVGHGIYLNDDNGVRHHATKATGITLDTPIRVNPDSLLRFSITFEPVDDTNTALDVIDPDHFRMYGIHDSNIVLEYPTVKDIMYNADETDWFSPDDARIEGVIHSADGKYTQLYFMNNEMLENRYDQPYSTIDGSGHFSIHLSMLRPKFAALSPAMNKAGLANVLVRPGDHLYVEIFDSKDGKEIKIDNLDGRETYQKLTNINVNLWTMSFNYIANLMANSRGEKAFSMHTPEEHWKIMMDDYRLNLRFADYMCWHNRLSAFESRMFVENIEMFYGWMLCELEAQIFRMAYYGDNPDKDLYARIDELLDDGFYTMTRDVLPNSVTLLFGNYSDALSNLFDSYPAKKRCDSIPETDDHYAERVLNTQINVIGRLTGWDRESLMMQENIILSLNAMFTQCKYHEEYRSVHAGELRKLYARVRQNIHNPYQLRKLDTFYEENGMSE